MAKNKNNKMKITVEQLMNMNRAISRNIELEQGRVNFKRVHKTAKDYNRQKSKHFEWAE